MQRLNKWLAKPENQRHIHQVLKYFWLAVGIFSLTPWGHPITQSIAVIFFVSVYANYVSHWSAERGSDAQIEAKTE